MSESTTVATKRKSIPRLTDMNITSLRFALHALTTTPLELSVSIKVDGFGARIGKTANGTPFFETSNSGPIYSAAQFRNRATELSDAPERASRANEYGNFMDFLLQSELMEKIRNGTKVVVEVLYRNFAARTGTDMLTFVKTPYPDHAIGSVATVIILGVLSTQDNEPVDDPHYINTLVQASTTSLHVKMAPTIKIRPILNTNEIMDVLQSLSGVSVIKADMRKNLFNFIDELENKILASMKSLSFLGTSNHEGYVLYNDRTGVKFKIDKRQKQKR
jgi:hypothetical protein